MQRFKIVFILIFGLLAATISSISQAQWQAMPATYSAGKEKVIKSGSGHYDILTGTEWGGVNCFVDPPRGGLCDVEVTISFNWQWTGGASNVTNLVVTPNGDLVGDGPFPSSAYYLTSLVTYGISATADSNTVPGPYNFAPTGVQDTFPVHPPNVQVVATGQVHSIAQMPSGSLPSTSARTNIYWTLP